MEPVSGPAQPTEPEPSSSQPPEGLSVPVRTSSSPDIQPPATVEPQISHTFTPAANPDVASAPSGTPGDSFVPAPQTQAESEPIQSAPPAPTLPPAPVPPSQPAGPMPVSAPIPPVPATPGSQPTVTVGGGVPTSSDKVFTATAPTSPRSSRIKLPKKLAVPVAVVLVLMVGSAAAYFGYYENPSVIYKQSLSNTGKGYGKLIDYLDQQSTANTKGYTGTGSYNVKASGTAVDGSLGYKSDGQNSDLTFDVGASVTRVNADIRSIKSVGDVPDIYLKIGGIKGLGTSLGDPSIDKYLNKLDNQWIVIDHTLIENLQNKAVQSGAKKETTPTKDQVLDEARAIGTVNQQYLFTTDTNKSVMKIVKKYGKETVDGHTTYHYRMALQPDNVKQYILAQRDALKDSKLDAWLKQNGYETTMINDLTQGADSAKDINSSDDFDMWVDASHRVIYKVRVQDHPNPAENYVDIGLDYKGGDDYPLFLSGKSQDGSNLTYDVALKTDINTKTHAVGFNFSEKSENSDNLDLTTNFTLTPNTGSVNIAKPAGAIPLTQVLDELGLGGLISGGSPSPAGTDDLSALGQHLDMSSKSANSISNALLGNLLDKRN